MGNRGEGGGDGLMSGAAAQGKIIPEEEDGEASGKAPVGAGVEEAGEAAEDMACSAVKLEY